MHVDVVTVYACMCLASHVLESEMFNSPANRAHQVASHQAGVDIPNLSS